MLSIIHEQPTIGNNFTPKLKNTIQISFVIISTKFEEVIMATADKDTLSYVTSISALSGFILYHIRNQMGLNHREIAKIFDITHTTYGNMERGDTAVNADFIYMLCTLSGIKFSSYFSLLEDLIINIEKVEKGLNVEKVKIKIIPSTDLQKIILENAKSGLSIAPSPENLKNLLIGQDINFFISRDLKERLSVISPIRFTKEQISEMGSLTSHEVEKLIKSIDSNPDIETEQIINSNEATLAAVALGGGTIAAGGAALTTASLAALGSGAIAASGVRMASGALAAGSATRLIGRAFPGIYAITAGYSLYKAYKQSKEEKKSKE